MCEKAVSVHEEYKEVNDGIVDQDGWVGWRSCVPPGVQEVK